MDGTEPQHPLTDSQLDRELESALGVDPSQEFLARVRTRITAEPEVSAWRLAIWRWTFEPLAGLAVIGIVLAVVVPGLMKNGERRVERVAAKPADVPVTKRAKEIALVSRDPIAVRVVRQSVPRAVVNEAPLRLSQPLFSEDERRALAQLVAAVEEGRWPPVVSETTSAAAAQPDARTALSIEPLVIDPLPVVARVQIEGEGQW